VTAARAAVKAAEDSRKAECESRGKYCRAREVTEPDQKGSVAQFMLACLPRAHGQDVVLASIYRRYVRWCDEQVPAVAPEDAAAFGESFRELSDKVRVGVEKRGGRVFVRDVRLVA